MADEKKNQGFTNLPNEVIELKISPLEKIVLIVLIRYYNREKGYSYPSYPILMEMCCASKNSVIKGLNELEKREFIKKEILNGKGNRYYINFSKFEGVTSSKTEPVQNLNPFKNCTRSENEPHPFKNCTPPVQNLNPTNTNINTNTITNNNMSDSKESDAPPGAFKSDNNNSNKTNENTITTKSKGEKEKEKNSAKKKEKEQQIKEVVEYLNLKTNRKYKPGTAETKRLINARLKDYTVEDLKAVIDFKVDKWLDAEWYDKQGNLVQGKNFLRPSTLFRESNFENYINELPSRATKKSSQSYLEDNDVDLSLEDIIKINLGKTNNQ